MIALPDATCWPIALRAHLAVLMVTVTAAVACTPAPSPAPPAAAERLASTADAGVPADARVATFELPDRSRPRRIPLRVDYPTGRATALPVVVFSHGAYSSKDDYAPITSRWAARGYAVVSITHLDSVTLGAVRGQATPGAWANRVADVHFVLEHLAELPHAVPALRARLDPSRVALAGHSLGGLLVQAFGGMTGASRETHAHYAPRAPRVRAIVVVSGVGPLPPDTTVADFATLTAPLFVSVGTEDLAMPQVIAKSGLELRREPFELAPPGHKYLLVLEGADHYLGGMVGRDDLPKSPHGPQYVAAFDDLSGLFLDAWLKDDLRARAVLDSPQVARAYAGIATVSRG